MNDYERFRREALALVDSGEPDERTLAELAARLLAPDLPFREGSTNKTLLLAVAWSRLGCTERARAAVNRAVDEHRADRRVWWAVTIFVVLCVVPVPIAIGVSCAM